MRIVSALVELEVTKKTGEGATTILADGKTIQGSLTCALWLLAQGMPTLLGVSELEEALVYESCSIALSKTKDALIGDRTTAMTELNESLALKTFLALNEFTVADISLYSVLYKTSLTPNDRIQVPNVIRYFDLIQHLVQKKAGSAGLEMTSFDLNFPASSEPAPAGKETKVEKSEKTGKKSENPAKGEGKNTEKVAKEKKIIDIAATKELATAAKPDPSKLEIRVGTIVSVKRHPDAETLYVEEVDVGDGVPRTVVSGLVKYIKEEDFHGQKVLLLMNLKPAKMRGIESQAMVLCATSSDGNTVELVQPPLSSEPGDVATFDGFKGNMFLIKGPQRSN